MSESIINLLEICPDGCRTLGPGLRYVMWTQGCPFNCKGCISPEGRPVDANKIVTVDALAADIISRTELTGLTISGGEPFLQYKSLLELLRVVKQKRPEMDILVFTGFTIEKLNWEGAIEILGLIDVLIDGPYIPEMNDGVGLRGSSNQKIHFLTPRLLKYKEQMETGPRKVEMDIQQGYTRTIGIPLKN